MSGTQYILGLPFFTGTVREAVEAALDGALVVAPSGPNLANELQRSPAYREAVQDAGDSFHASDGKLLLAN